MEEVEELLTAGFIWEVYYPDSDVKGKTDNKTSF